jgi:hypothetical protein
MVLGMELKAKSGKIKLTIINHFDTMRLAAILSQAYSFKIPFVSTLLRTLLFSRE